MAKPTIVKLYHLMILFTSFRVIFGNVQKAKGIKSSNTSFCNPLMVNLLSIVQMSEINIKTYNSIGSNKTLGNEKSVFLAL
ncbi:hypothetical protein [Flavobacterium anhuiense]|uniref:hypothetical protein n=1 Tax=Flavobacterium anhuiense TaxID=459526 RepID=UPI0013EC095F|nr:hypothetical protein [Flavobacterium anhuiense]